MAFSLWLSSPVWDFYTLTSRGRECKFCKIFVPDFDSSNATTHTLRHKKEQDAKLKAFIALKALQRSKRKHAVSASTPALIHRDSPTPTNFAKTTPSVQETAVLALPTADLSEKASETSKAAKIPRLKYHTNKVAQLEIRAEKALAKVNEARKAMLELSVVPTAKRRRVVSELHHVPRATLPPPPAIRAALDPDLSTTAGILRFSAIVARRNRVCRGETSSYPSRPAIEDGVPQAFRPERQFPGALSGSARALKMALSAAAQTLKK